MPTKQQYLRNQQIIANRLALQYVPKVYAALWRQVQAAVKVVRERGIMAAQGNIHGDIVDANLGAVITQLYTTAAIEAAKKFKPRIKAGFGENPDFINAIISFFRKYLLDKVVLPITDTTKKHVNEVLDEAVQEGWSVDEAVKRLEDTELLEERARKIVRTEAVRAMNFSQLSAADQSSFKMNKQWLAVDDNRTRLTHSNHGGIDGEIRPLDEAFSNGLQFPGDPNGSAKETIQCRCTLAYIAVRDERGRLVKSDPNTLPLATRLETLWQLTKDKAA